MKSPYNPVTNSGHEVMAWPYREGMAALLTTDGVEKNTIQWAPDGLNFEIMAVIKDPPGAGGLFRTPDFNKGPWRDCAGGCATPLAAASGATSAATRSMNDQRTST